jgi:hypothetical protein
MSNAKQQQLEQLQESWASVTDDACNAYSGEEFADAIRYLKRAIDIVILTEHLLELSR